MGDGRGALTDITSQGYTQEVRKIGDVQISFRSPPDLTEAIDREVERLSAERPGEAVTRSDVVRAILYRALLPPPSPPQKGARPGRKPAP